MIQSNLDMRDGEEDSKEDSFSQGDTLLVRDLSEGVTFEATSEKYEVSFMRSQWNSVPGKMNCMYSGPGGDLAYRRNGEEGHCA